MLTTEDLRERLTPLFYTRMRLGEFDPPGKNPYEQLKMKDLVQSPEHQELAVMAALKTFVLIKNDGPTLPIEGTVQTLAVSVVMCFMKEKSSHSFKLNSIASICTHQKTMIEPPTVV